MGAPKGNQYWQVRSVHGIEPKFTPEELLEKSNEYFKWIIDNPFKEQKASVFQGKVKKYYVDKMRPFTIEGLCNYIGIVVKTFHNYEKRKDYLQVTTQIRQVIKNQKFEAAASGFLEPNIIARDLGLKDKKEIDHTSKGERMDYGSLSTEELIKRAKAIKGIEQSDESTD